MVTHFTMKKHFLLFFLLIHFAYSSSSQVTVNIIKVPEKTPPDAKIYMAGNFNGWNPKDENFVLKRNKDGNFSADFKNLKGTIEFKFTRGGGETVEKAKNCNEVANRKLTLKPNDTLKLSIENWADNCITEKKHTALENVKILKEDFEIPQLNRNRRIWLYLPPDYDKTDKSYPVLYMHDGQNLFDEYYSYSGEWGIDESLNQIFEQTGKGIIVVGIDNGGTERINELTLWRNKEYGGGDGSKYAEFVVKNLKPYIDAHYRTKPDRANTGIMGSSLGGLQSFAMVIKYNDVFGKAGLFSPSFWFSGNCFNYPKKFPKKHPTRLYILAGGKEGKGNEVIKANKRMYKKLLLSGYTKNEIQVVDKHDGEHREWFWKREFPDAVKWLFEL